jgi:hypothetical protein
MLALLVLPAVLQGLAMFADELVFHRKRGLPRWERLGHPLDTLTVAACYGWLVAVPASHRHAIGIYVGLCAFSCLFITKDEFVHSKLCEPLENWLHALLFVLHPIVFLGFGLIWFWDVDAWISRGALASTLALVVYQVVYWNVRFEPKAAAQPTLLSQFLSRSRSRSSRADTSKTREPAEPLGNTRRGEPGACCLEGRRGRGTAGLAARLKFSSRRGLSSSIRK